MKKINMYIILGPSILSYIGIQIYNDGIRIGKMLEEFFTEDLA